MRLHRSSVVLFFANLLLPVSLIIFASGFFPHKPFIPGLAEYQDLLYRNPPVAPFNKVVFMVIDALRSDFVYSNVSGFQFTQSLIRDGFAVPFTSHAQAPTVTMPRVKALTTGSIPSFLDMVLNIAESDTTSTLAHQDTWIAQMAAKNDGALVMYGDDTWLKLFPDTFDRFDGTTSFFVSDFTEVDNNVTRHVTEELNRDDWSAIIMHYLGMDHIGHKSGSVSVNMLPKQREMDSIVKEIYTAFESAPQLQESLLVLCGDHGMTNGGNHGGSAPGETSPAMLFISPKLERLDAKRGSPTEPKQDFEYYTVIEQSDVVPTLAGLLGFPVPLNNLGVFIPDFLPLWGNADDQVQLLLRNAMQLLEIAQVTFPHPYYDSDAEYLNCKGSLSTSEELACLWKQAKSALGSVERDLWSIEQAQRPLLAFCHKAQSALSSIASNYHAPRLYWGIVLSLAAVTTSFLIYTPKPTLQGISPSASATVLAGAYVAMMFASSYVEEEHQFWYWASAAWANLSREPTSIALRTLALTALRVLRRWNQSGQKYAGSPDIALLLRQHPESLALLDLLTYVVMAYDLCTSLPIPSATPQILALVLATGLFKLIFTFNDAPELFGATAPVMQSLSSRLPGLVALSQIVFVLCGVYILTVCPFAAKDGSKKRKLRQALVSLFTIFLSNQVRATNIPVLLLFRLITGSLYSRHGLSESSLSIWTLLLAHTSFFALGGTNGISSIDLSNAYNGISSYNPIPVGILLFVSNWAGPIYWSVVGTVTSLGISTTDVTAPPDKKGHRVNFTSATALWQGHVTRLTFFMSAAVFGVEAACCVLREHLFVWTVFSPKFLYVGAWVVGWHLCINILLGGLITLIWR